MLSIGEDDQDLDDTLVALTTALHTTAASYCGFQLTIFENHSPVILSAFTDGQDGPVGTSLRLPLGLVSSVDGDSRVVFFAGNPGAFTDLAADLSHALGGIPVEQSSPAADGMDLDGTDVDGHRKVIELDVDLPPLSHVSGLTGVAELTVLNRAIGMLMAQGHSIEQAHQVLRREAAAAGVEPHVYAARILRR
ncbi:MAG TPA: ANTAR domain-containing protein [Propionibacteriaceae bacterium]